MIGIGVQGLADAFILMRYPFESEEAQKLNIQIFETLYYGALEASCEMAEEKGTYETYEGSPISKGVSYRSRTILHRSLIATFIYDLINRKYSFYIQILQYDMWDVKPTDLWDWNILKEKIAKFGIRNSLLIALMPTSSTAQILGNNESIEPYKSNIYFKRVSSEEFQVINPHLLRELTKLKLWNDQIKDEITANNGSIQASCLLFLAFYIIHYYAFLLMR